MENDKGSSPDKSVALPEAAQPSAWAIGWEGSWVGIPRCGLLVGRSRLCDLVLDQSDVSRRHLRLTWIDQRPWVIDLGSANGILLEGAPIARAPWPVGGRLVLGGLVLVLEERSAPLPQAMMAAWNGLEGRPADSLRELAGATSCSLEADHSFQLGWEAGSGWDDLGPLRRTLLDAALSRLSL